MTSFSLLPQRPQGAGGARRDGASLSIDSAVPVDTAHTLALMEIEAARHDVAPAIEQFGKPHKRRTGARARPFNASDVAQPRRFE
jgi:hypothetical protein